MYPSEDDQQPLRRSVSKPNSEYDKDRLDNDCLQRRFTRSKSDDVKMKLSTVETSMTKKGVPSAVSMPGDLNKLQDSTNVLGDKGDAYYGGSSASASSGAVTSQGFTVRQELSVASRGLVLVLVGLPARGKSFISRKLEGFLKWQCLNTKTFNVGKYRRHDGGAVETGRADFFGADNEAGLKARQSAARDALEDLLRFLDCGGDVGVFDATNSTRERRTWIQDFVKARANYHVVFVEVICDDPEVVQTNMRNKVLNSPDFAGLTLEEALQDLMLRVKKYEDVYETIDDDSTSYIKLYNMSSKVLVNRIYGMNASTLMPYLMGIHIGTRPIWLVRAAEVPKGKTQDARLSQRGVDFAEHLGAFISRRLSEFHGKGELPTQPLRIFTSTMPSTVETVLATLKTCSLHSSYKQIPLLNPLDRGRLDGPWWVDLCADKPPWDELQRRDPEFYAKWETNKTKTRFPGGESYFDVMTRVEGALLEIEMSTRPVMVVSHMTALQVLVAYFSGSPISDCWETDIPLHSVIEVNPTLGGGFVLNTLSVDEEELPSPNTRANMTRRNSISECASPKQIPILEGVRSKNRMTIGSSTDTLREPDDSIGIADLDMCPTKTCPRLTSH